MRRKGVFFPTLALLGALAACATAGPPVPIVTPSPTPDPYVNDYAQADVSELEKGLVRIRYTGGEDVRVKAQITREDGTKYNYDLPNDGTWESYTLTEGDGEYTLRVMENIEDTRYKSVFDAAVTLALTDPAEPFRQASQYISFTPESQAALLAGELTRELESEEEKIQAVFDYVTGAIAYDTEKPETVEPGYLPDVDRVLEEKKGICFDYTALMAAMLRSQGIACRMAVGWAGEQYHAWVEVPTPEGGWRRMDPTFFSARQGSQEIRDYIADDGNYRVRFYY